MFIAYASGIKRMTLGTSILETKLIGVSFKISFNHARALAGIVSLRP